MGLTPGVPTRAAARGLAPWRAGGGVGLVGGGVGKVAPALSFSGNFAFLTCAMNLKATT
jgi:hypothetical protein